MEAAEFILYVADQARATAFYRHVLAAEPVLDVPGMTEFDLGGATLGLMPAADMEDLLARQILGARPRSVSGTRPRIRRHRGHPSRHVSRRGLRPGRWGRPPYAR